MKKLLLAVVVSAGFCSTATMASAGNVKFLGSVMAATCNLEAVQTSGAGFATPNVIQFGTVETNSSTSVDFSLQPVAGNPNKTNCDNIFAPTPGGLGKADIQWVGTFDTTGNGNAFKNTAGTAANATVKIEDTTGHAVTSANQVLNFDADDYTADHGFKHKAILDAGSAAGSFDTVLSYLVTYN
ncbi:hypothetical protein [Escherichia coli]|uniref:hypothetical protein n=1 Tax=Escherichia coli TaxID=562 RepID=UPI00191A8DD9|nr:hypothetical protein [Escherichia coli]CAD6074494.1 putative fimbrial protein FanC [Escherichia coli]CAD6549536.1 putative fimbrial protein FanC [Escherichia coli]